jgi:hypothetical protein
MGGSSFPGTPEGKNVVQASWYSTVCLQTFTHLDNRMIGESPSSIN